MGALDLIAKAAKGAKKTGPFFSKADVVLDELQRGKGTGNEFLTELVKKGAKPTELRERGIEKALKDKPKISKSEVKQVFEQNPAPRVSDEVYGGDKYQEALDDVARTMIGDENVTFDDLYGRDRGIAELTVEQQYGYNPAPRYGEYKTPGGDNYREILLKLPIKTERDVALEKLEAFRNGIKQRLNQPGFFGDFMTPDETFEHEQLMKAVKSASISPVNAYASPHWKGEPNVLAHIRVQDFTTPEGKKVLLVDEIQSDWHQQGRKEGYKGQTSDSVRAYEAYEKDARNRLRQMLLKEAENEMTPEKGINFVNEYVSRMDADTVARMLGEKDQFNSLWRAVRDDQNSKRVPDAPFKKNWHELAMKRVLDYAAEGGYDTVAITPGIEQAKRYDLSQHVDAIIWERDPDGRITFTPEKEGMALTGPKTVGQKELADHLGKEVAEKILNAQETSGALGGVDLQVGGEGMKGFYDKILPDYLNNFGKQYGSSVGQISLKTPKDTPWNIEDAARFHGMSGSDYLDSPIRPQLEKQFLESRENHTTGFHSFDITPQLREEIKNKGLPMYGKVSMPVLEGLAAGTGATTIGADVLSGEDEQQVQNPVHFTENPDAMLLELMQRN